MGGIFPDSLSDTVEVKDGTGRDELSSPKPYSAFVCSTALRYSAFVLTKKLMSLYLKNWIRYCPIFAEK